MCYGCIDFCTCTEPFIWDISNVFDNDEDLVTTAFPITRNHRTGTTHQQEQYLQHHQQHILDDHLGTSTVVVEDNVVIATHTYTSVSHVIEEEAEAQQQRSQYNSFHNNNYLPVVQQQQSLLLDNDHLTNNNNIASIQQQQMTQKFNEDTGDNSIWKTSTVFPPSLSLPMNDDGHSNGFCKNNNTQLASFVKPRKSSNNKNDNDIYQNNNRFQPYWQFMEQSLDISDNDNHIVLKNHYVDRQQHCQVVGNNELQTAIASYDNTNNNNHSSSSCNEMQEFLNYDNNKMKQQQQHDDASRKKEISEAIMQHQHHQEQQQLPSALYPNINNTVVMAQQQERQETASAPVRVPLEVATKMVYDESSSPSSSSSSVVSASLCKTPSESITNLQQQGQHSNNDSTKVKLLRPLSAYNYFFRDERDWIVQLGADNPPTERDFSNEKLQQILHKRWYLDPVKPKRSHARTHGKISFKDLSRVIAKRWKDLSIEGIEFYETAASLDLQRFQREKVLQQISQEDSNRNAKN